MYCTIQVHLWALSFEAHFRFVLLLDNLLAAENEKLCNCYFFVVLTCKVSRSECKANLMYQKKYEPIFECDRFMA